MKKIHEKMMALALAEARKGWGKTSPNPMVGAVVVKDGKVLAKGYHAKAGGPHAEINALEKAGDLARGADMYVTLEPCNHQGRTGPCSKALIEAGVSRVFIAQLDPHKLASGGADALRRAGIEVVSGILEEKARELNLFFNKFITTRLPYVLLKSAATLDGKLATETGHSRWVTGEKSRGYVHRIRSGVDAILVGKGTILADDPTLNTRLPGRKKGRDPIRIVLDTSLSLSEDHRAFNSELGGPAIIACGPEPESAGVRRFEKKGVRVLPLPLSAGRPDFAELLKILGAEDVISVLVEGGADVNASVLLQHRVVDRILFFYAPKIVGGRAAPTLVGGEGIDRMDRALDVEVVKVRRFGPDLMIEALPKY